MDEGDPLFPSYTTVTQVGPQSFLVPDGASDEHLYAIYDWMRERQPHRSSMQNTQGVTYSFTEAAHAMEFKLRFINVE